MSDSRGCEVCGGRVKPVEGMDMLGHCEKCGLVYLLKARGRDIGPDEPIRAEGGSHEPAKDQPPAAAPPEPSDRPESRSHWWCPDCETYLYAENDGDLQFVKREHLKEFHPNKSPG